jgi:hypothetical protein
VRLTCGSYRHRDKSIGEVLFPDFEPAGWVNRGEFDEALRILGIELDHQVEHVEDSALPKPDEFGDSIGF